MQDIQGDIALPDPQADIIDRLRYLIRLSRRTQQQFSEKAGVDATVLSKILSGRLKPSESFVNKLVVNLGVSKLWLTEGRDVPYPRPEHAKVLSTASEIADPEAGIGAPVYDIDVTAGCRELSRMFTEDRIIGRLKLPSVDPEWPVVTASGDSMLPRIHNGAYLAIRPIRLTSPIAWGQIYVVVLDDYRMVKYLRKHPGRPDLVVLHSANPEYDDIEIPRSDIRGLYLVEVILNYEIIG
ncbi:MAG: XRE family transcriptional regulator [Muribaculaceae bacterium]|nr:XRE family transcriptional regulator [Muribaculaceae bacterium]